MKFLPDVSSHAYISFLGLVMIVMPLDGVVLKERRRHAVQWVCIDGDGRAVLGAFIRGGIVRMSLLYG